MSRVVPFLRVAAGEASARWHARLVCVQARDPESSRLRIASPVERADG